MKRTLAVVDLSAIFPMSSCRWVRGVGTFGNYTHYHKPCRTGMQSLQMLLLHSLCVEKRIVVGTACSSARSIGLIEIIGGLSNVFWAMSWPNSPCKTSKSILLFYRTFFWWLAAAFNNAIWVCSASANAARWGWLVITHYCLCHVVGISNRICFVVTVKALRYSDEVIWGWSVDLVLPTLGKLVFWIQVCQFRSINQLSWGSCVQMWAEFIFKLDRNLANFFHFFCEQLHRCHSLNAQLIVLVLDSNNILLIRSAANWLTIFLHEGAPRVPFNSWW